MARKKRRVTAPAVVFVGRLSGRSGGRRTRAGGLDMKSLTRRLEEVTSSLGGSKLSRRLPSRRERKKIVRRVTNDLEKASRYASHVGALLGMASAGAELISSLRAPERPGEDGSQDSEEYEGEGTGSSPRESEVRRAS